MAQTTEITLRKEYKINVRADECAAEAIERWLKPRGWHRVDWVDGKDLRHICYCKDGVGEIWMSGQNYTADLKAVKVEFDGDACLPREQTLGL